MLVATAVALPFILQSIALSKLDERIDALRPQAAAVEALRKQIAGGAATADVVVAARKQVGTPLQSIALLTELLPDDTYVTTLGLRQRKLTVSGRSASAARLIGAMAANPLVHGPAFVAPVIRNETNGEQMFSIRADLGPEMSRALPTGRKGQLLALGLTILVLAVFWLGVVMPLIDWHGERADALVQKAALVQRMEALIATRAALQEQAKAAAAGGAGETALLEGDSESVASAALQELLQAMFMQAGVHLNSVETLPGDETGAYRRIRLRVSFTASWPVLMSLLKELEIARPALLIDELSVQPALHRISTAPDTFDVSCVIFGIRAEPANAAGK